MAPPIDIELVLDARAQIGESATWVAAQNALYWTDIKAPALFCSDIGSWQTKSWALPADIGAFALDGNGRALVALRTGLFWLDLATGALQQQVKPPFDPARMRFNEGACDSTGRFWIGIMADPLDGSAGADLGSLYSYCRSDGFRAHPDISTLTNGMAWNADETLFYLSHSYERLIISFAYDRTNGSLGAPREFARVEARQGIPDGAAIDVEGGYWCAIHGAGRVHRYTRDGVLDRVIKLPVSQPTMCCFAGDDMDELYITSAREKLGAAQLLAEPHAGGIFRLRPGVRGQNKHWRVI